MTKLAAALMTLFLLVTACASEDTSQPESPVGEVADADNKAKNGSEKKRPSGESSPGGASAGGASAKGGDASEDRDGGGRSDGGSGSKGGESASAGASGGGSNANYPDAGTYTFSQSGYEEFCDSAGRCEKEKLPARQPVTLSYAERSGGSTTVVTEQEMGSRLARTWTEYTSSGAHITKLYIRFSYSGFTFERTYVPRPAVEAMRFPLTRGESWAGKWDASTSGSYNVSVGEARRFTIGGRSVTAYLVDTTTEFKGDFDGKSRIKVYIDPRTKSVIASDGVLNVTSQFGRYTTSFDTTLTDGPGY